MDTIVTLHEQINTSNQTSPHFERHESFVEDIKIGVCELVRNIEHDKRCDYIKDTQKPCKDVYLIDYYSLLYCRIGSESRWKVAFFSIVVILIAFYAYNVMTSTTKKFFCPSINVFSELLGLSENVAGVTLLAFANGINDFLSGIAGRDKTTRLYFTDTHGANLCLLNIVGGSLLILQPFSMRPYTSIRDIGYFFLHVLVIDFFYKTSDKVTLTESIALVLLYVSYLTVVIAEHLFMKKKKKRDETADLHGTISTTMYLKHTKNYDPNTMIRAEEPHIASFARDSLEYLYPRNHDLWRHFWESLDPINYKEWANKNWIGRIICIIQMPYMILLNLFLPHIDHKAERRGWSKLLNCTQIVILPFGIGFILIGRGLPFKVSRLILSLFISVPFSIYIFQHTSTIEIPHNHLYLSIITILGSLAVSYVCASEILFIFDTIGVMTGWGNTFLGATLMAWSNCFMDFLTSFRLARQGQVGMGWSGCIGAAIFNLFVSLILFVLYSVSKTPEKEVDIPEGSVGETVVVFMIVSLLMLLIGASTTNFALRRSLGILLVLLYVIFLIYVTLGELEIIHSYGTDHRFDMRNDFNDFYDNVEEINAEEDTDS